MRAYVFCERCGVVVAIERGLAVAGPLTLVAVFLDLAALSNHELRIIFLGISVVPWAFALLFLRRGTTVTGERGKEIYVPWPAVAITLVVTVVVAVSLMTYTGLPVFQRRIPE